MSLQSFNWSSQKYIDEVEHGTDPGLLEYQRIELKYLTTKIEYLQEKTFIDVGAGYGRILPHLAKLAKKFIAIERDSDLLDELQKRASHFPNCEIIEGDGTILSELLKDRVVGKPVIISPQNTLGPWIGDRNKAVDEMRKIAEAKRGEIVISLFCREAINDWGIPMYKSVAGLLGKYDPNLSDLENGIFKTDTGYESYWFSKEEREEIKRRLSGKVVG